jgi:hypothetical protein
LSSLGFHIKLWQFFLLLPSPLLSVFLFLSVMITLLEALMKVLAIHSPTEDML